MLYSRSVQGREIMTFVRSRTSRIIKFRIFHLERNTSGEKNRTTCVNHVPVTGLIFDMDEIIDIGQRESIFSIPCERAHRRERKMYFRA